MKLGTLHNGKRDGALVVVSRDLTRMVHAGHITPTLQSALDDWTDVAPRLEALYSALQEGKAPDSLAFEPSLMAAPLPRAYSWMDGSAYLSHMRLARELRGASMIPDAYEEPLMYEGVSSKFTPATAPLFDLPGDTGLDIEGEIAVILGDVPMRATPEQVEASIRLFTLVNDVSLRTVFAHDTERGRFGTVRGKPPCAMALVAVTPDELGTAWNGRKLSLPLVCHVNDKLLGAPNAGKDMVFDYPTLIEHACFSRPLGAGTVLAAGTVSNEDSSVGCCCIAEQRMVETKETGTSKTQYLKPGDRIRIEMLDPAGLSIFGAIDQSVESFR